MRIEDKVVKPGIEGRCNGKRTTGVRTRAREPIGTMERRQNTATLQGIIEVLQTAL